MPPFPEGSVFELLFLLGGLWCRTESRACLSPNPPSWILFWKFKVTWEIMRACAQRMGVCAAGGWGQEWRLAVFVMFCFVFQWRENATEQRGCCPVARRESLGGSSRRSLKNLRPVLSQSQLRGRWPNLEGEWLLSSLYASCRHFPGAKPAEAVTCQG